MGKKKYQSLLSKIIMILVYKKKFVKCCDLVITVCLFDSLFVVVWIFAAIWKSWLTGECE